MQIKNGEIIEGTVTGVTKYGAFVKISEITEETGGITGMIHISEISGGFVKDISEFLEIGQNIKAVVLNTNIGGKLSLSIKQLPENIQAEKPVKSEEKPEEFAKINKNTGNPRSFEDMMNKFKRDSDEKISGLKYIEPKRNAPRRRKD